MTQKEQQTIDQLLELAKSLKEQNQQFQQSVRTEITGLQEQLNKKEMPVSLEKIIFQTMQQSLQQSIEKSLVGYASPIIKLAESLLSVHNGRLKTIIETAFQEGLNNSVKYLDDSSIKESVAQTLAQNIVRSILSAEKSQFDKITQEMKADATFRAKLTLAVDNLLNEYKTNFKSTV